MPSGPALLSSHPFDQLLSKLYHYLLSFVCARVQIWMCEGVEKESYQSRLSFHISFLRLSIDSCLLVCLPWKALKCLSEVRFDIQANLLIEYLQDRRSNVGGNNWSSALVFFFGVFKEGHCHRLSYIFDAFIAPGPELTFLTSLYVILNLKIRKAFKRHIVGWCESSALCPVGFFCKLLLSRKIASFKFH